MNLLKVNELNHRDISKIRPIMKTKIIFTLLIFTSVLTFAQTKLADKFFEKFAYIKASELYEEAYEKGDDSQHVLSRLGDCYYNNSNTEKAGYWYKIAIEKYADISPEYIYKYIQSQRSLGNYAEANTWLKTFNERQSSDSRANYDASNLSVYKELSSTDKVYVELTNLDLNSSYSDFGSFIHNGIFYFATSRNITGGKVYEWNEQPYLDIYQASIGSNGLEFSNIDLVNSPNINSDFHESSVAITDDGKTMYFTRDNLNKRNKLKVDKKSGTSHLKIYKADYIDGSWIVEDKGLSINDDVFSTGHPALSPDESKLYFVSDREGGYGQTDLYVVDILESGELSSPRNMGDKINTEGREMFPFIAKDSTVYFSSDGYLNLGLLDIFKSDLLKDENAVPSNMGAPFNSGFDDFGYYVDSKSGNGYLSSNRPHPDSKGNDDIYSFASFECKQTVSGVVRHIETSEPIANATVKLIDQTGRVLAEMTTSELGEYAFELNCNDSYTIVATKTDFKDDLKELTTTEEDAKEHEVDLHLTPLIIDNQIVINPIFFDFDKWNIRTDAKYELENIVDVLRQHPTMVIKIESHTDSRGSKKYNVKLSDRRAKSTRNYIISRGIAKERLESAIGYGENQLLNECADRVKCSEEKHQENRRSYFYIVKD